LWSQTERILLAILTVLVQRNLSRSTLNPPLFLTRILPARLTRWLALWVVLTALPSLLVGGWLFVVVYRDLGEARQAGAAALARLAVEALDRLLYERVQDTLVFSRLPAVRAFDLTKLHDVADELIRGYAPYYEVAVAIDQTGRIVAANRVDATGSSIPAEQLIGRSVAQEPWFTRALRATSGVVIEEPHVDPLVETVMPGQRPVLSFSAPVKASNGQVVGVWSTRVSLAAIKSALTRLSGEGVSLAFPLLVRSSAGSDIGVDGLDVPIRIGPWPSSKAAMEDLPRLALAASTGFADWPGLGWRVEVYQPANGVQWRDVLHGLIVWVGLLAVGGGIGLGVIVHHRLVRPMLALKALAEGRARAARTVPVERVLSPGEFPVHRAPAKERIAPGELGELTRAVGVMIQEHEQQVARLTVLNGVAQSFQRDVISVPALMTRIAQTARELTGARYAALGLFDETGEEIDQLFTAGIDEATKAAIGRLPTGRGLLGHLAKADGVLRLADLRQHPAFTGFPRHHPPMTSFMGISIRAHGQLFGRLYVTDKMGRAGEPEPFTDTDEQMITALAYLAGAAIESAHLLREIKVAESRYRSILNAIEEGIFGVDISGLCLFANQAGAGKLGYLPDEIVGQSLHQLVHPKRADGRPCAEIICPLWETLRTSQPRRADREVLWHRDGPPLAASWSSAPLRDDEGRMIGMVVSFTDLTERERLEEQLRQAQKMEAIGRLAGGIAHDFNNILTAILGFSAILSEQVDPDHRRYVDQIRRAGERAATLTRQILAFSRKDLILPRVLDLNDVLAEMDEFLRRLIGEDIALLVVADPNVWPVKVDPGQVEQVIMNLAINARDAMPGGGRLTLETANVTLDEAYCRTHPEVSPGSYVMLAVSDTGHGMDAATLARCLDPFFTTKPVGKGTGLGLSTVYGIVKQSGGTLSIYSEPGHGTTVKIFLPRADEAPTPRPEAPAPALGKPCTETVLVVDDDEAVRDFVRTALAECGYTVLVAQTGEEALALSARLSGRIHLLLTDVVLSGINGRRLAEQLQVERPDLKVLYMSGYAENAIVHHGILDFTVEFLRKPFTADDLRAKVRRVLDS
jgi:PAS domain S-box-containing protein